MSLLSWFKTRKKEEELLDLQIQKEKLAIGAIIQDLKNTTIVEPVCIYAKPYKKVKFVNDVLTVIFNDGSVINKAQSTVIDFEKVRTAVTEADVINVMKTEVMTCNPSNEEVNLEPTYDSIKLVSSFPDFETKEECIYMNGIDRSVPPLLINRFAEIIGKYGEGIGQQEASEIIEFDIEYSSLKKFWLKCCLNPSGQSAEDLYTFLSHHNMKIDRHGNFFAYRRVVKVKTENVNDKLIGLISGAYNNVKAVWKKKPKDFRIEEIDGEYSMHKVTSEPKGAIVGNLENLYLQLPNMKENRYTDAHTGTMDYRVGQIAYIPRNECDDNNQVNCSKGLHAASKKYDYTGFGDTPILMIINPMDAVSVPLNEVGKLRVSRWFFAMTLAEEDKYILDDEDFDVTNLGDIFEEKCLANIEQHAHTSFAEEVKRHTFTIPQMSNVDIKNISSILRDMNSAIKNRIVRQ